MNKKNQGFTIVELLIVIVIIAILAAITIVAYNGIQQRAYMSAMKSDYRAINQALTMYKTEHGKWPLCATGDDNYSQCNLETITPQLSVQGLPTRTGPGGANSINYAIVNNQDRLALQLRKSDGSYCKMGVNMHAGWYSSAPECW